MFEASSSSGEIPSYNLLSSPSLFLVWKGRQSSSTSFTLVGNSRSPPAILLSAINISCGLSWLEGYAGKLPLNCWFQRRSVTSANGYIQYTRISPPHPLLPPQYFHQLPPPSGLVSTSYGPDYIPQPSRRGPALVLCQGLVRLYPI